MIQYRIPFGAVALATVLMATTVSAQTRLVSPDAVARLDGTEAEVRVGCTVEASGRLTACEVWSLKPADAGVASIALAAARESQVWPAPEGGIGWIHFPVQFELDVDYDRRMAMPVAPTIKPPITDEAATSPPVPEGRSGAAWSGLRCVVTSQGGLRECGRDYREAPPGSLGGILLYTAPFRTLAGDLMTLPEGLPANPDQVRTEWTSLGPGFVGSSYIQPEIPSAGVQRLFWEAMLYERAYADGSVGTYLLREFDCAAGQVRVLLAASAKADGLRTWNSTQPSDWTPVGRPMQAMFARVCGEAAATG